MDTRCHGDATGQVDATSGQRYEGRVTRLSRSGAEIECAHGPPPFANLKLHLVRGDEEVAGDVYAKVSGSASSLGLFVLRFTSVPPEVASVIESAAATTG